MSLADLLNLGAKSAEMLAAAGIEHRSQLEQLGPVRAYLAAKQQAGGHISLNLLWAIAGALNDTHWNQLSSECKRQLRAELQELTGGDGLSDVKGFSD